VPLKLLLEVGLGIDGSTERAHRDFEFPGAKIADCNDGGRTKPLHDSKIALFRRVVLLNHRTESLTDPEVHSIYCERAFFPLCSPVFLHSGFGACDGGSSEIDFLLNDAHNLPQTGKSSQPHGNRGTECALLNGSKLKVCESALSIQPRRVFGLALKLG
jgi:hypothetical protein